MPATVFGRMGNYRGDARLCAAGRALRPRAYRPRVRVVGNLPCNIFVGQRVLGSPVGLPDRLLKRFQGRLYDGHLSRSFSGRDNQPLTPPPPAPQSTPPPVYETPRAAA